MKLFKLVLDFLGFWEAKFLAKVEGMITSLTSEPALTLIPDPWPATFPSRTDLTTAFTEYQAAYNNALDGSKAAITTRNKMRGVLEAKIKAVAPYLESVAQKADDLSILDVTGMDRRQPAIRSNGLNGTLPAPELRLTHGTVSGVVSARVTRDVRAGSYEGQIAVGDPFVEANFKPGVISKRATHIEFTGLTPGQLCHIRMRAIGSKGPGAWSDVASIIVT